MKYKICKFINDNGEEWYQVQQKCWIFYRWLSYYDSPFAHIRTIHKFASVKQAKDFIKDDIENIKRRKIKKVECFDYVQ